MTRCPGYTIAAVLLASVPAAVGGSAAVARGTSEPPLETIVAVGTAATAAVVPDGTWRVELPPLYAGDTEPAV
jgi:hypothetical protein